MLLILNSLEQVMPAYGLLKKVGPPECLKVLGLVRMMERVDSAGPCTMMYVLVRPTNAHGLPEVRT